MQVCRALGLRILDCHTLRNCSELTVFQGGEEGLPLRHPWRALVIAHQFSLVQLLSCVQLFVTQ